MDMNSSPIHSDASVAFPLKLKDAIEYLASQTPDYKPNNNNLHNKIWQQLSQRLRLIFDRFPDKRFPDKYTSLDNYSDLEIVNNCLSHRLSPTRKNIFKKKLRYLYTAVTMYYMQHKDSPLSSNDIPEKWLHRKNTSPLKLQDFIFEIDNMCNNLPVKYSQDSTSYETIIVSNLKISRLESLIASIEDLVTKTYKDIKPTLVSYLEMRNLLSGIDESLDGNRYLTFFKKYYNSNVEKILADQFVEYCDYCEALKNLINIYTEASDYIESQSLLVGYMKTSALPATWDEVSNTKTEVSQLELDFFSYLLKIIPPRSVNNKNLANQLYYGKWYVLPIEARDQIIDYIIQLSRQPRRIARFFFLGLSDDEEIPESMYAQIENICMRIRYPHRNKAYNDLIDLYCILNGNEEILLSGNLENIIEKVFSIYTELQKATEDTVQNNQ